MRKNPIAMDTDLKIVMDDAQRKIEAIVKRPVTVHFKISVHEITTEILIDLVCKEFGMTWSEIIATSKKPEVIAKHIFVWLAKIYTRASNNHIAHLAGLYDHSSASHCLRSITDMIQTNNEMYIRPLNAIEQQIMKLK